MKQKRTFDFDNDTIGGLSSVCPVCKEHLGNATNVDPYERGFPTDPTARCMTACCVCGSILMYEKDLSLRLATADERVELFMENPETYALLQKLASVLPSKIKEWRKERGTK